MSDIKAPLLRRGVDVSPAAFIVAYEEAHGPAISELGAEVDLLPGEDGTVSVEGLMVAPPRRRGHGRMIVGWLCDAADRAGVTLTVKPEPISLLVDRPIPLTALQAFYGAFGCRPAGHVWGGHLHGRAR